MATKDWKKHGGKNWLEWRRVGKIAERTIIIYKVFGGDNKHHWEFHLANQSGRVIIDKKFTTKSKALAYAKSYMRKH